MVGGCCSRYGCPVCEGRLTKTQLEHDPYLQLPVLNQTGITDSYDYYLPPDDPENRDLVTAVHDVVDRLGLKIKRGRERLLQLELCPYCLYSPLSTLPMP